MALAGPSTRQKPIKFEDAFPGSIIRISGQGIEEPFEATVVDMQPEHGPNGLPAIWYTSDDMDGVEMIFASGLYQVELVRSTESLRSNVPPSYATMVRRVPVSGSAVRFDGGPASAAQAIMFAVGHAQLSYVGKTDVAAEHLKLKTALEERRAHAGDWIVLTADGVDILSNNDFVTQYEVVDQDVARAELIAGS